MEPKQLQGSKRKRADGDAPKTVLLGTDFGGLETPHTALLNTNFAVRHLFSSENNPSARRMGDWLFKDIETRYVDMTTRDNKTAPRVDLYVAGVPCQAWASGGKLQGLNDARGSLWANVLDYTRHAHPKAAVMECAPNLMTMGRFKPVLAKIRQVLHAQGYRTYCALLKTHEHGLPQARSRTYVVAVLRSAERTKFRFPEPLPGRVDLECIVRGPKVAPKAMLPSPAAEARQRTLVVNELKKLVAKGHAPQGRIIVELGTSDKFSYHRADGIFPTITAQRATRQDWWIADLGRKITIEELMMLQGLNPNSIQFEQAGVSVQRIGHMVGNAMSLNVLERLLPCVLASVGMHPTKPAPDRWALLAGQT